MNSVLNDNEVLLWIKARSQLKKWSVTTAYRKMGELKRSCKYWLQRLWSSFAPTTSVPISSMQSKPGPFISKRIDRRKRDDLIQFFKFYSNINTIDWQKEPTSATKSIRRLRTSTHSMIRLGIPNCSQREHFFLNRVILSIILFLFILFRLI